jgi:hypothetical protein
MKVQIKEVKSEEIEPEFYGFPNKLRKDNKSWVITIKPELVNGCNLLSCKKLYTQLAKFNGRLILITFLDGKNYFGGEIKE